jgi:hypothetical protein
MLDANRELVREDGKVKYARILEFAEREVADRFSAAVIAAVDRFVSAGERVESGAF